MLGPILLGQEWTTLQVKVWQVFTNVPGPLSLAKPVSSAEVQAHSRNLVSFTAFVCVLGGGS